MLPAQRRPLHAQFDDNNEDGDSYLNFEEFKQALEIIEGAGLARTRLMFDAYHVGREGLSPEAEYDGAAPHVGHVQFASVPDRREPFGGTVDMARFLAHLAARGYDGWVGCEYLPASTVEDGLPELRAMAEAFDRAAAWHFCRFAAAALRLMRSSL